MNTFTLKSQGLGGQFIQKYVFNSMGCTGDNISPDLFWENAPAGTKSFALFFHDADAPTASGFWHWAAFNIPASYNALKEGLGNLETLPDAMFMGRNDYGSFNYGGPCPPKGDFPHQYTFTLYALNVEKVDFDKDIPLAQCEFRIKMQMMIERASLVSYYGK